MRVSRFQRRRSNATVEELVYQIAQLVAERQELRRAGSPAAAMERNRLQIARAQWELSYALIARHLQQATARTAA